MKFVLLYKKRQKMTKKRKKTQLEKFDGLNPHDLKNITRAIRQVWSWSYSRRLAIKRATDAQGFPRCEKCKKRVSKVAVDHIHPVGEVNQVGYLQKLFVPSHQLQCLCKSCHAPKTKKENAERRAKKKAALNGVSLTPPKKFTDTY